MNVSRTERPIYEGLEMFRAHGGGVPEFWGKDSPYHPGTGFLGTPPDHLEVRELCTAWALGWLSLHARRTVLPYATFLTFQVYSRNLHDALVQSHLPSADTVELAGLQLLDRLMTVFRSWRQSGRCRRMYSRSMARACTTRCPSTRSRP